MNGEPELVFVYGTLRKGGSDERRMEGGEFVGAGWVKGRLYRNSWRSGLVLDPEGGWVDGEVWRIPEEKLTELDQSEGMSEGKPPLLEYRRVEVVVEPPRSSDEAALQRQVRAWVWEWTGAVDESQRIKSGDWLDVVCPRPPAFCTCLGCLSFPAVPVGAAMIAAMIANLIPSGVPRDAVGWIPAGGLVLTPVVALILVKWAGQRREKYEGIRPFVVGLALVWLIGGLMIIVGLLASAMGK